MAAGSASSLECGPRATPVMLLTTFSFFGQRHHWEAAVPLPVAGSYREDPTILGQGEGDWSGLSRRFYVFPFRAVGFSPQHLVAGERSAGWRLPAQRPIIFELLVASRCTCSGGAGGGGWKES